MTIFVVFHKIRTRQALIWLFPQNNRKRALFAFSPRPPVNISFQLPVPLIQKIHLPFSLVCRSFASPISTKFGIFLESSWNLTLESDSKQEYRIFIWNIWNPDSKRSGWNFFRFDWSVLDHHEALVRNNSALRCCSVSIFTCSFDDAWRSRCNTWIVDFCFVCELWESFLEH